MDLSEYDKSFSFNNQNNIANVPKKKKQRVYPEAQNGDSVIDLTNIVEEIEEPFRANLK